MKTPTLLAGALLAFFVGTSSSQALAGTSPGTATIPTTVSTTENETPSHFPQNGKTYYIYCDNDTEQFFYNDGGTLNVSNGMSDDLTRYQFTCTFDGTYYQFYNASSGKYFGFKAFSTTAYNFTLSDGTPSGTAVHIYAGAASRYLVMKNTGAFDQAQNPTFNKDNGDYSCNFIFIPADEATIISVTGCSTAGATATLNGVTKSLPATFVKTSTSAVTDNRLSVSVQGNYIIAGCTDGNGTAVTLPVTTGDAAATYNVKIVPDVFSTAYGEKWVRLTNTRFPAHGFTPVSTTCSAGQNIDTEVLDLGSENHLWCLVGTPDNFRIYPHGSSTLAITHDGSPANGEAVTLEETTQTNAAKQAWQLVDLTNSGSPAGFAISPLSNSGIGLNPYNGVGNILKFYGNGDGGNRWTLDPIDLSRWLTVDATVSGDRFENNNVAELRTSINGATATKVITGSLTAARQYLPLNATASITSYTYRGFDYTMTLNGTPCEALTNYRLTDGVNALSLTYTANEERILFKTPDANGKPYRIPAITTAMNGDVIAISDNRPCGSDVGYGEVDIKARISTDNGATWGNEFFLFNGHGDGNNITFDYAFGDAAVVADRESNKVLVMSVCGKTVCHNGAYDPNAANLGNPNRVAKVTGEYNESTRQWEWTTPVEVTNSIYSIFATGEEGSKTPTVTSLFIGSGRIMQSRVVKKGQYYRLYAALWTKNQGNRVIYSDDFGDTWHILGTVTDRPAPSGDEPKCEELPDGTVVLSSRKGYGRWFNLFTFAATTGDDAYTTGTWGTAVSGISNNDSGTNGEIYSIDALSTATGERTQIMLQSVPLGSGRNNVAIWYKPLTQSTYTVSEFAAGWTFGKQVSHRASAYSTMTLQQDGRLGFLFEEEPGGYCIIYTPLTIEEATGGAYMLNTPKNAVIIAARHAQAVLDKKGVGYPTETAPARATLAAAIATAEGAEVTNDNQAQQVITTLNAAVTAYKATTTDIQLPVSGKAYRIVNVNFNGVRRYMKYAAAGMTFVTDEAQATPFVCHLMANGKYVLTCNEGKYYIWKGKSGGTNSNKGYMDAYDATSNAYTDIAVRKFVKNGYCDVNQDALFGYVYIQSRRSSTYDNGCLILSKDGAYDNSNDPYFKSGFTSAMLFEEVDYPNTVTLHPATGINDSKRIGTFSAPFPTVVPEGVGAYVVSEAGTEATTQLLARAGEAIPAGTGVILYGDIDSACMEPAGPETKGTFTGNLLVASAGAPLNMAGIADSYILSKGKDGNVAFFRCTGGTLAMNRAYLNLAGSSAASLRLIFNDDVTAIGSISTDDTGTPAAIYDLAGRRVTKMQKGSLYIRNGQKIVAQ